MAISNLDLVKKASGEYPGIKSLISKLGLKLFTDAGYEALSALPEGGKDKFLSIMLLVSRQYITPVKYKDALKDIGILEKFGVGYGAYVQDTRMGEMPNEDPIAFGEDGTGLKNGAIMLKDRMVRKPVAKQDFYGKNKNYYNHFSWQDFDVRRAWLKEDGGLEELMSQAMARIRQNIAETEYSWFFEVLSGAINSTSHPLKDTQKIGIAGFDLATAPETSSKHLIEAVKTIVNTFKNVPTVSIYNAAGFPSSMDISDMKMLVRADVAPYVDTLLAYAYNDGKLSFPIDVEPVPNFGGLYPVQVSGDTVVELQPVYSSGGEYNGVSYGYGSVMGYIDKAVTVNGYAEFKNNQWVVNVTSGVTTADTTFIMKDGGNYTFADPNEDVIAVIAEKGVIFELVSEELNIEADYIRGYRVTQTYVSQYNTGVNYRYTRNLITISKTQAPAESAPAVDAEGGEG